eukprot:COSAG06_NODE_17_length_34906_cov_31.908268_44_plen_143_part_00
MPGTNYIPQVDTLAEKEGTEVQALKDRMHSADFVVLLHVHSQLLNIQAELNKRFQSKDIMVGDIHYEIEKFKQDLMPFTKGEGTLLDWNVSELLAKMKYSTGGNVSYKTNDKDGNEKEWSLTSQCNGTRAAWLKMLERIIHE